jgi:hypothetical protein
MQKVALGMKGMLLRIGIDTGTDGALAPIFEDGTFEYIPISERNIKSREDRTYGTTIGRSGKPLSRYLPKAIESRKMHYDPEFSSFTYGDPTAKRRYLLKLEEGDLLVFYAGLAPYKNSKYEKGLYIVGYFTVSDVIDFNRLTLDQAENCYKRYPNNAHLKRMCGTENLVIVIGDKRKCKLMEKAIAISQVRLNRKNIPYHVVSANMESLLGISGSIQRSIPPRFIIGENNVANLKRVLGV